jgi:GT2 family glycosyltransferase
VISVVIVSFNAREHLRRCLASLFEYQKGEFEVIVVDNASGDESAGMVAEAFPSASLVRNTENTGFSRGANAGTKQATGDVIAYLNPDCTLDCDAFSEPAAYLRQHPDIGALGLKILDPSGELQLSTRRFPGLSVALFNRYSILTRLLPNNPFSRRYLMSDWRHDDTADVDWVSGACFMTTRAALDRVGLLDEGYFWGFEDVDFCQRVHRAGLRVVYYPATAVTHEIGASARTVPSRALIERHKGMWRYYRGYVSTNPVLDALVFFGVWVRCGAMLAVGYLKRLRSQPEKPAAA